MNGIRAIATAATDIATWAEALVITVCWAVLFGILSVFGLAVGASVTAAIDYFLGCMSCSVASAALVAIAHRAIGAYPRIVAFERESIRRAKRLEERRHARRVE